MTSPVLSGLPERERKASRTAGPVRRAVGKVGRNDPCPCGSGRKYKACHEQADRERNADASDVEGLTLAELNADLEKHLDDKRLAALKGHELARLDASRVPEVLRSAWVDLLGQWGEHDAALAAVTSWWPPPEVEDREVEDDRVRLVAEHASRAGRRDIVLAAIALRGTDADLLLEARVVAAEPQDRLALLEAAAVDELDAGALDLGFALLATGCPALGIHVARSELVLRARDAESDQLYASLVEARDQLLAPPWDPIDEITYQLERGVAPEVDRELASARDRMTRGEAALRATQEALEQLRSELASKEEAREAAPAPVVEVEVPANRAVGEDPALRELRERMEHLKRELKDRHRERNALRKELEEAKERVTELEHTPREAEAEEGDDDEDDDVSGLDVSVAAKLRVPVFPDDFSERLEKVPEATARAALMRVGELCAGFDVAFREVRPLRGFEGTWRVKVGRSYRLLFRPLDRTLEVIDLLHRQDLEKRLFRLRRGGE
ncbi:MAG: SEC-C domain-containing protein [Alphaproteobacteria bacterium]|nr:SEC-C domain-containing protein [Alphaproteobacteria bacterium]